MFLVSRSSQEITHIPEEPSYLEESKTNDANMRLGTCNETNDKNIIKSCIYDKLYLEFQALLHQTQLVYSTWDCLLWFCDAENTVGSEQRVDPGTPRIERG